MQILVDFSNGTVLFRKTRLETVTHDNHLPRCCSFSLVFPSKLKVGFFPYHLDGSVEVNMRKTCGTAYSGQGQPLSEYG